MSKVIPRYSSYRMVKDGGGGGGGVLPRKSYTGRHGPKGVPFLGFRDFMR